MEIVKNVTRDQIRNIQRLMFSVALTFPGLSAEDVVQDAWLKYLARPRKERHASAYVHQLTVNVAKDHLRTLRKTRRAESLDAPVGDGEVTLFDLVADEGTGKEVIIPREEELLAAASVIHAMPIKWKLPLLMHACGAPYEEIAQVMEVPVGTVRSRLHHARKSARAALTA